jgi:hypothetical protein
LIAKQEAQQFVKEAQKCNILLAVSPVLTTHKNGWFFLATSATCQIKIIEYVKCMAPERNVFNSKTK